MGSAAPRGSPGSQLTGCRANRPALPWMYAITRRIGVGRFPDLDWNQPDTDRGSSRANLPWPAHVTRNVRVNSLGPVDSGEHRAHPYPSLSTTLAASRVKWICKAEGGC